MTSDHVAYRVAKIYIIVYGKQCLQRIGFTFRLEPSRPSKLLAGNFRARLTSKHLAGLHICRCFEALFSRESPFVTSSDRGARTGAHADHVIQCYDTEMHFWNLMSKEMSHCRCSNLQSMRIGDPQTSAAMIQYDQVMHTHSLDRSVLVGWWPHVIAISTKPTGVGAWHPCAHCFNPSLHRNFHFGKPCKQ